MAELNHDTCVWCDASFYRCSICGGVFSEGESVYCCQDGEEHLCGLCYEEKYFTDVFPENE